MKRIFIASILFLGTLCGVGFFPVPVDAQSAGESIRSMHVDIFVTGEGTLKVEETIVYDFDAYERHGIYRTIPYSYTRDGVKYNIRIDGVAVTDEDGSGYTIDVSRSGGEFTIRIGDPDLYVTGTKTYVIGYSVQRAINFFEDHDELYWNATGTEWSVPIDEASATVYFPSGTDTDGFTHACYTGAYGSDASDCTIDDSFAGSVTFTSDVSFLSYEGMSVVVGFPKNIITKPTAWQNFAFLLQDNWYFAIPIIFFVFMHLLWLKKGRDPKGRRTIVPQYESPYGLRPAELGALWDEKADTKDISAAIVGLAVRGYIKISYLDKKDYEFSKIKSADGNLTSVESKIMNALFGSRSKVTLKSLKNKFYAHLSDIESAMYTAMVDNGFYSKNPRNVKGAYFGVSSVVIIGLIIIASSIGTAAAWVSAIVTAAILFIYSALMPQKTMRGAEAKEEALGFKWFLSVTETERLKFHNAPEKKPEQFEEFLPYAMVFGVEKQWAEQFKDMYIPEPSWYEGAPGTAFSAIYFAGALSSMNNSMKSTFTSRPSSAGSGSSGFGGGGFSGGGFGGGGGGSW